MPKSPEGREERLAWQHRLQAALNFRGEQTQVTNAALNFRGEQTQVTNATLNLRGEQTQLTNGARPRLRQRQVDQ